MKKLVLVCTIFLMTVSTSSAFDFFGTPTNPWQEGQWNAGFSYSYSDNGVDISDGFFDHVEIRGTTPNRLRINKYCGIVGRGLTNNVGVYGIVGAASARSETGVHGYYSPHDYRPLNFGHAPVYGFGVKTTFYRRGKFQAGAMTQCTWIRDFSARRHIYSFEYVKANIDLMEWNTIIGGTYQVRPWCSVYGGGLIHVIRGDFRAKAYCNICRSFHVSRTFDIQQSSWYGGVVGTYIRLNNGSYIMVEYAHTPHSNGIATAFMLPI